MRYAFIAVLVLFTLAVNAQDEYTTKNRKAIGNFEKAKQYYLMMAYDNASAALMEAAKADPEFIEAWLLLGQVQTDAGNIEKAAVAYRKAVEILKKPERIIEPVKKNSTRYNDKFEIYKKMIDRG